MWPRFDRYKIALFCRVIFSDRLRKSRDRYGTDISFLNTDFHYNSHNIEDKSVAVINVVGAVSTVTYCQKTDCCKLVCVQVNSDNFERSASSVIKFF